MVQFHSNSDQPPIAPRRRRGVSSRQRWRLWMLLIALGLVIATMRQLNRPQTAQRLGQLFGTPEVAEDQSSSSEFTISTADEIIDPEAAIPDPAADGAQQPAVDRASSGVADVLAQIQDNTYFRPAETTAWFDLLARLQKMESKQLSAESVGELSYAQLLKQPQIYRGQVVTLRGTLRREEVERPAENALGIDLYHRLVIQPRGGGHWPFIVYCLELPSDLPRGNDLQATVSVTGFFFKNWSYAWQDGLGIAPVVLARSIDWQPPVAQKERLRVTSRGLTQALTAACGFAALVVYLVIRNTRRPRKRSYAAQTLTFPDESAVETVQQQLQRLTDAENLK